MVLPFHEDKDASSYLGALMCLRQIIPNLSGPSSCKEVMQGMRGSFGSQRSHPMDMPSSEDHVNTRQLLQVSRIVLLDNYY